EWALPTDDFGRRHLELALAGLQETGDRRAQALCLSALASSLVNTGHVADARGRLLECLNLLGELDLPREGMILLDALGEYLIAVGQPAAAARMLGTARSSRSTTGSALTPQQRDWVDRLSRTIDQAIGAERAGKERSTGESVSVQAALAEAKLLLNVVQVG